MANAAPAYSYEPQRRPRVEVVPGRRPAEERDLQAIRSLAFCVAAALVVVALLAGVRVALTAATVQTSLASQEISAEIEAQRSSGNTLEVTSSVMSSTSRIEQEASALGMAAADSLVSIVLEEDVVVCDEAGNLSLTASVAQAAALED